MANKYGWFTSIKGGYPSLAQEDFTAEVGTDAASSTIVRGMVIALGSDGKFGLPAGSDAKGSLYFALQGYTDSQAEFAGSALYDDGVGLPTGSDVPAIITASKKSGPAITGLSVCQSGEYETDQFTGTLSVGDLLVAGTDGQLVAGSSNPIAIVTRGNTDRWCNDCPVAAGRRTGGMVSVIRFRTI